PPPPPHPAPQLFRLNACHSISPHSAQQSASANGSVMDTHRTLPRMACIVEEVPGGESLSR
ncbi:MAG: hypothetical protein FWD61_20235, partial [Phycisphaerales bacterium]|nr:hypothetical protein [Phycisphaerales bacterium]